MAKKLDFQMKADEVVAVSIITRDGNPRHATADRLGLLVGHDVCETNKNLIGRRFSQITTDDEIGKSQKYPLSLEGRGSG
jgi:hypothetical protein